MVCTSPVCAFLLSFHDLYRVQVSLVRVRRIRTCEVAFVFWVWSHMWGDTCRNVRSFDGITCVGVDNARWHDATFTL